MKFLAVTLSKVLIVHLEFFLNFFLFFLLISFNAISLSGHFRQFWRKSQHFNFLEFFQTIIIVPQILKQVLTLQILGLRPKIFRGTDSNNMPLYFLCISVPFQKSYNFLLPYIDQWIN